jgi:aspartate/methionine/tyrosine aminotransferase
MRQLLPFELEDFFVQYEHRPGLINLASSDAMPWALDELRTRYAVVRNRLEKGALGYPDVRAGLIPSLRAYYNNPAATEFLPTSGAAEAIFLAMQAIRCESSGNLTVAIPRPAYGAYDGIARLLAYEPCYYSYDAERRWELNREQLLECSGACDVVIVTNPHNPTGSVAEPRFLDNVAEILQSRGGLLIVDEVFRLPEEHRTRLESAPNVFVIGSLSKVYGLPGLRLGWVAGQKTLVDRMKTIQQYLSLSVNWFADAIGSAVLMDPLGASRHQLLVDARTTVQRWAQVNGDVASTTFPSGGTTVILSPKRPRDGLFDLLLNRNLLLVPGRRCFGWGDGAWFRLGYGTSQQVLSEGLDALESVLRRS